MMTLIHQMASQIVYIQQPLHDVVEGVSAYAHQYTDWRLVAFSDNLIRQRHIDFSDALAVISDTKAPGSVQYLAGLEIPWVNIRYAVAGAACVLADNRAAGRLVGEHFAGLGLAAHAIYRGLSADAHQGFALSCGHEQVLEMPTLNHKKSLKQFLASCPKPCGVLCGSDGTAVEFMHFVMSLGYRLPEDFAISGMNNNPFQALCAPVPLTSVDPNYFGMAYTAATLIHQDLKAFKPMPQTTLVAPKGVVARRSTASLEYGGDLLSQVVQYLHNHLSDRIQVEDAILHFDVSRSSLERYFKQRFRMTPGQWLQQRRLDLAQRYLRQEDWDCAQIAEHCGFSSASYFSRAFKKQHGVSPQQWRLTLS